MSVWASAVGSAVLPLCWENKVMLLGISAADSIAALPHQGYFVRTQPHTELQGKEFGRFILAQGAKNVYLMMPQTPFTETVFKAIRETVEPKGVKVAQRDHRRQEDLVPLRDRRDDAREPGPVHDGRLSRREHRDGEGPVPRQLQGQGHGLRLSASRRPSSRAPARKRPKACTAIAEPAPAGGSSAYAKLKALVKRDALDTYICQAYDHANLAILAMAKGKDASGTGIRDNIRKIANNDSAHEGRQRARRPEGDRRGQGDQVFGRVRPVQVRRQRQHHRGRVPHHAGEGRQAGRGEEPKCWKRSSSSRSTA